MCYVTWTCSGNYVHIVKKKKKKQMVLTGTIQRPRPNFRAQHCRKAKTTKAVILRISNVCALSRCVSFVSLSVLFTCSSDLPDGVRWTLSMFSKSPRMELTGAEWWEEMKKSEDLFVLLAEPSGTLKEEMFLEGRDVAAVEERRCKLLGCCSFCWLWGGEVCEGDSFSSLCDVGSLLRSCSETKAYTN